VTIAIRQTDLDRTVLGRGSRYASAHNVALFETRCGHALSLPLESATSMNCASAIADAVIIGGTRSDDHRRAVAPPGQVSRLRRRIPAAR